MCILAVCVASELMFISRQHGTGAGSRPPMSGFYITMMLSEWALAYGVLQGTKRNGIGIRELIGGSWKSPRAIAMDILIAMGMLLSWLAMVAIASTLTNSHNASVAGSSVNAILPVGIVESILWVGVSITAGFSEEFAFRGYFQRQFQAMTGSVFPAICLQAIVFGLLHLYEGVLTSLFIMVFGILFGLVAKWRRSLRPGMLAHAWADIIFGIVVPMIARA
ncbi:MAG: CPBP family intramembrane glutamic endopeptidase [Gemmatimonadaceae bacterium]